MVFAPIIKLSPIVLALVLGVGVGRTAAQPDTRPNLVWVTAEDMNDWMGCYGDSTVPTPSIDRLANEGLRFSRAYMTAGVCSASRSAIATGAMQTSLGVHNHRSSRGRAPNEVILLPDGVKTVYELIREAGYHVYSNPGKDDFNFEFSREELYDHTLEERLGFTGPVWRRRAEGQPFFAQVQLAGGKNSGKFRKASGQPNKPVDPRSVEVPPYYPDIDVIREEIALHYDCIAQTDNELRLLLEALEADGLLETTVVFFWADHGMRLYRHKQWLYEGGIRVPLLVRGPGIEAGGVRGDLVSGIDITATTLALAGVPLPDWCEGRNLLANDHRPRSFVVSARDRCDFTIDRVRAVTTERYKYLRNYLTDRPFMQPQYRDGWPSVEIPRRMHRRGELTPTQSFWWGDHRVPEELYDLRNDPHETHNLAQHPEHRDALQRHRRLLADWIVETGDLGQRPEPIESLRGALRRWGQRAVNPEYAAARETLGEPTPKPQAELP